MSQLFNKLSEIEGQIDGEIRLVDKKMKDLRLQRQKLVLLQKALKPKTTKPKKIVPSPVSKPEEIKS